MSLPYNSYTTDGSDIHPFTSGLAGHSTMIWPTDTSLPADTYPYSAAIRPASVLDQSSPIQSSGNSDAGSDSYSQGFGTTDVVKDTYIGSISPQMLHAGGVRRKLSESNSEEDVWDSVLQESGTVSRLLSQVNLYAIEQYKNIYLKHSIVFLKNASIQP